MKDRRPFVCHKLIAPLVILSLLTASPALAETPPGFDPSRSDPQALRVVDNLMTAMGGEDTWDSVRYLRFDMVSERSGEQKLLTDQYWDKHTGRHRLEAKTEDGQPYVVLENVNTGEGAVYVAGRRADPEQEKALLQKAQSSWKSATYWLFMPYKMKDPGVALTYEGEEKLGDVLYDKVLLTHANQDRFWAYINRDTHLMDRWSFLLGGGTGEPTHYTWGGWKPYGKLLFSPERVSADGSRKLLFPHLQVFADLPDSVFTSPEPVQAGGGS